MTAGSVEKAAMHEPREPLVINVILNTNRREDTLECLRTLQESSYQHIQTLVLDNNSSDGSQEAIHRAFPAVKIIKLEENLGYAGNNNVGIHAALEIGADWVFVLNEDVTLAKDTIARLLAAAQHNDRIGILGPMVYHYDEPTTIQSAGGILDDDWLSHHRSENQPDEGQFAEVEEVDWISGCAILVRREVIEQVGVLDERFFYYWEETEWCFRARSAGWKVLHVPSARLWHKGVQKDYQPSPNITYYWTRNWLLFLAKHRAPLRVWITASSQLSRTLISWTLRKQWRWKRDHRDAMWQGMVDFIHHRWGMRAT